MSNSGMEETCAHSAPNKTPNPIAGFSLTSEEIEQGLRKLGGTDGMGGLGFAVEPLQMKAGHRIIANSTIGYVPPVRKSVPDRITDD